MHTHTHKSISICGERCPWHIINFPVSSFCLISPSPREQGFLNAGILFFSPHLPFNSLQSMVFPQRRKQHLTQMKKRVIQQFTPIRARASPDLILSQC